MYVYIYMYVRIHTYNYQYIHIRIFLSISTVPVEKSGEEGGEREKTGECYTILRVRAHVFQY